MAPMGVVMPVSPLVQREGGSLQTDVEVLMSSAERTIYFKVSHMGFYLCWVNVSTYPPLFSPSAEGTL